MSPDNLFQNKSKLLASRGNAKTGNTCRVPSLWSILGPLAFLFWYCGPIWNYVYVTIRNCPTISSRRYCAFCFFLGIQYFCLFPIFHTLLSFLPFYCGFIFFSHTRFPPMLLLLFLLIWPFCSAAIIFFPLWVKYKKRIRNILFHDLGFSDPFFKYLDFKKVERQLHISLLVNILISNVFFSYLILVSVFQRKFGLDTIIFTILLYIVAAFFFYTIYLLGRKLLELFRTPEDLIKSPPLIDDPFLFLIYGKRPPKNKMEKPNQFFKIVFAIAMAFVALTFVEWRYHPLPITICIIAIFVTYTHDFLFSFSKKFMQFLNNQNKYLYAVILYIILISEFFVLGMLQNENFSMNTFIFQSFYELIPYPTICLCFCFMFSILTITTVCVWFWRLYIRKNITPINKSPMEVLRAISCFDSALVSLSNEGVCPYLEDSLRPR